MDGWLACPFPPVPCYSHEEATQSPVLALTESERWWWVDTRRPWSAQMSMVKTRVVFDIELRDLQLEEGEGQDLDGL